MTESKCKVKTRKKKQISTELKLTIIIKFSINEKQITRNK